MTKDCHCPFYWGNCYCNCESSINIYYAVYYLFLSIIMLCVFEPFACTYERCFYSILISLCVCIDNPDLGARVALSNFTSVIWVNNSCIQVFIFYYYTSDIIQRLQSSWYRPLVEELWNTSQQSVQDPVVKCHHSENWVE